MPVVTASQLQGKTLTLKNGVPFYRVSDINSQGDRSKAVSNLPAGYQIKVEGTMGISFTKDNITGSIMSSGVTILEGLPDKNSAIKLHQDLLL